MKANEVIDCDSNVDDELTRYREAEWAGGEAGKKYDADFRRLYMSVYTEAGFRTTPVTEPKNPFKKGTFEAQCWWNGYTDHAYKWLRE
jgi:hypothetical protein